MLNIITTLIIFKTNPDICENQSIITLLYDKLYFFGREKYVSNSYGDNIYK